MRVLVKTALVAALLWSVPLAGKAEQTEKAVETIVFPFVFSPDQVRAIERITAEEDDD